MREEEKRYFGRIEDRLDEAFEVARAAKKQGHDPKQDVEIPVAKDMADRVENILGIEGVAERVRELEGQMSREEAALELVTDFVDGNVGDYDSREGKVEGAVRTAVALLTEGVVAAPIEGIDRVEILENDDGTEFVNVYYAGPIRSAGGTAQALSVLVADYARSLLGIDEYKGRDDEIERYVEEINLYDKETGLQYSPKDKETRFIATNMPIMLDGEATGDEEVSGYRDLERVDTNSARGGMCLVMAEGIALKAPKIQRYTRQLDEVEWPWLQDLIDGTIGKDDGKGDESEAEDEAESDDGGDEEADAEEDDTPDEAAGPPRVEPATKFLRDLIAGRPVFGHPSAPGGFRLRYGRARNHGFATAGVHPATMHIVDDFIATGTQIKTERPGKAGGVVPVDSIEGPTVRLANGDVRRIDDPAEAEELQNGVEKIIDLGEYLVNFGEFVENNHPLAPASYVFEWWIQDFEATEANVQALRDDPTVSLEDPTVEEALAWADEYDAPLHPKFTYLWHDISVEQYDVLADAVAAGEIVAAEADGGHANGTRRGGGRADGGGIAVEPEDGNEGTLLVENTPEIREMLENLLVEHRQTDEKLRIPIWRPLARTLGLADDRERTWSLDDLSARAREWDDGDNAIEAVNETTPYEVRERAPTRIGGRMGRPEKSERRDLSPAVHTLFPIGEAGGSQRDVGDAAQTFGDSGKRGEISVRLGKRKCPDCGTFGFKPKCSNCGGHTNPHYECDDCGTVIHPDESGRVYCDRCEWDVESAEWQTIDLNTEYRDALESVGERESSFEILKGVKGLTSSNKTPEPIEKGILRAKHDVSSFKDGTVRYDMTDLPVTAVRPEELDVTADHFRELGYETDIDGEPLRFDDQLVELKVQDIVLSKGAAKHMMQTANFVDDLLAQFYGLEPFYKMEERDDLIGELVFGMAPHTSAAVVGRVVGFTTAAVGYAHPYFHAAKRRNCFHPETKVWYRDEDDEWHFGDVLTLVEERLADPETDDFGTLVQELDGDVLVPSLTREGEETLKPVEAVSKHVAPDQLVRVETRAGRELTVTPDHTMIRASGGGFERVSAHKLDEGDSLPSPTPPAVEAEQGSVEEDSPALVDGGETWLDEVVSVEYIESDVDHTYSLTVAETNSLVANDLHVGQCDGDEDCVMLLMDGLLNFSREYLPDKRGGSVAEDSRLVAVGPDGEVHFTTFGDFWDRLDSPVEYDGKFRKRTCFSEGWKTYAFDENHEASLKPIEKAIRYEADEDEQLLRIETQFGRSLDITEHHSLFRYDDGIEEVAGADLSEGDLILAPRTLDIEPKRTTIDVADCVDDPYVFIDETVSSYLTATWENAEWGSETRAAFDGGLSYRLSKDKAALETLDAIAAASGSEPEWNPTIGLRGSSTGIDRHIDIDESFAWLLGMFVAEGSLSGSRPTIYNSDEALVEQVVAASENSLGAEPAVRWSNKAYEVAFPAVFREVLYDLGFEDRGDYNSSEKVIPDCILRSPDEVALSFLRGFIAGDGSETGNENYTSVAFYTTSDDVKDGIVFLLHRFGLVANVSRRERDSSRQPIYTVTVSGGTDDNPLQRLLDGERPYLPKSLVVSVPDALLEIREMDFPGVKQVIPKYLKRRDNVSLEKLRAIVTELSSMDLPNEADRKLDELRSLTEGDLSYLRVQNVERVDYDGYLYDLQVGGEPVFTANWLYAHNSMDAPLVMSSRIDPSEIDDEAHNMDIVRQYPREFYEATRRMEDPDDWEDEVTIAEEYLGTDREYMGFDHTHDTTDIAAGPDLSAYKTLGSMMDKMDAQLFLARKLRSVDETDVAERVIEYHFLPDLIGNLRAFSRQETRCLDCGEKYRRMPLTGECRECDGRVNLTVHQGSVNKYMDTAIQVAEEFDCRDYTKQRLEVLEKSLESIFENDKNKQSGIADFM
ncbi:DNA polymerase II large subunit [Haloferax sp. S1W]|uniref:DNA polymerase II large subunit n=1 Tax=Haloferax sp. S1W TaxID=3377110 RepID=UPI0037C62F99